MPGDPLTQAGLFSYIPEGGHRLVLSQSEGGTGVTAIGSAYAGCPHGDPAAQQPHWLLLMSAAESCSQGFLVGSQGKAKVVAGIGVPE